MRKRKDFAHCGGTARGSGSQNSDMHTKRRGCVKRLDKMLLSVVSTRVTASHPAQACIGKLSSIKAPIHAHREDKQASHKALMKAVVIRDHFSV